MVTQDLYLIYKYCLYGYTGSVSYLQVLFVWLHRICILFAGRGLNRVWFYRTSLTLAFIFVEHNTHLKVSVRSLLVCRHGIDMSFSSRIWGVRNKLIQCVKSAHKILLLTCSNIDVITNMTTFLYLQKLKIRFQTVCCFFSMYHYTLK